MLNIDALPSRIRSKIRVSTETGCWEWTAAIGTVGYGKIVWEGRVVDSHRVVYGLLVGPIPDGLVIDHLCHTPECRDFADRTGCTHRRCQNPEHMSTVTQRANVLRGMSAPAMNARKTHCAAGHEYTSETMTLDSGARRCKICRREADQRRRPRGIERPGHVKDRQVPFKPRGLSPKD